MGLQAGLRKIRGRRLFSPIRKRLTVFSVFFVAVVLGSSAYHVADSITQPNHSDGSLFSAFQTRNDTDFEESPWVLFHPAWKRWDPELSLNIQKGKVLDPLEVSAQQIAKLVDDPKGKLEPEFKVPHHLRSRVSFWMQIYSRFNTRFRVVHDRRFPDVIYGYIDFRPVYRRAATPQIAATQIYRMEKKILDRLNRVLSAAVEKGPSDLIDAGEKVDVQTFLSSIGGLSESEVQDLIANIRTQSGQSDMFLLALYRSRDLLPHIESVFKKSKLPSGLARIPFVESSFNVRAESNVGAVGIWQFMPETARQMVSSDARAWSDPLKQTQSATKLFAIYRKLLPDWGTTITAYNSGVGKMQKLVKKYRLRGYQGVVEIPQPDGLGFAGQNFYSEFLAAHLVEAYKEDLFKVWLEPAESSLVFRGLQPFPRAYCDM